ncbi:MAG: phosphoadenosine phosphosulfate reductase [Pseudotabrizicola sp.]|uniref:phosphoadenosine phosphosulfate reductase n=1 Tax=Pseudotabrizicola sp. TaxID=2939647 RepID=UPI00273057EF|nr:phosphoadenosine phosphosulfate reductase [Pseudotabrizicola sp.]MDP2079801.1 phosphoadenosine phosphosulfate reductase [Pseudotabrizicola sp.]MDZ7574802.1 phosphoadenosine phosphosulfate reductase [Pseudotabrizicola sp.]
MSDTLSPPQTADVAIKVSADAAATNTSTPVTPADEDRANWLALLDQIGDEAGYFEQLGSQHWAFFLDEDPTLLVTFEQADDIRARPGQMPLGHDIAKEKGWSHLCIIADGDTYYRDPRVYGYFDRLVDDAFFEDFDAVLFMGAGVQGYAAAAFSVAAPGAAVIAISPRATLSPDWASWDKRSLKSRKKDFTSRYGYAPDMIDGAGRVFILHDPDVAEDAMHAALFRGDHVTHLRCPRLAGRVDWALTHMQVMSPLAQSAIDGTLTRTSFAQLWRGRRNFGPYLRALLTQAQARGRIKMEKAICQNVVTRLNAPKFRKRLADILAAEVEASLKD